MMQPTYAILQDWNDANDDGGGKTGIISIEIAKTEHHENQ